MNTRYSEIENIPSEKELRAAIARARYERSVVFASLLSSAWSAMTGFMRKPVTDTVASEDSIAPSHRGTIGVTERSMKASVEAAENIKRILQPADRTGDTDGKRDITARAA